MIRRWCVLILSISAVFAFADEPTDADLREKPITTANDAVGKLLRDWYKGGTAAGNVGDWYDNRDGEHSPLDLSPYPQLRKVAYSADDFKMRRNWALQPNVLPHVVFGNSSTSAPPNLSGSNPRSYYSSPQGIALLQTHYAKNNLYIYPEHRDHDPGHNGVGDGYGDLYPTNTPFLLISQGSSGSDQPFMRAMPFVLAAFRPEVKKKLVESGLLYPTVQMIFRSTNRHLKKPDDYFTGKAHPTVFEGSWVHPLAMVKKAHAILADEIPPLVKLRVVEEDEAVNGKDYFEPAYLSEKLADTSTVIARIYRGSAKKRRMVVKASDSVDVNKKPLTFRWVVLRGDPKRVRVTPRDKAGTEAEIVIDYHARAPIEPGSAMASNRVDIGVFANNGVHDSAPAFVTSFTLDSEARTYDAKGRITEIAHGTGFTELKTPDPVKLLAALGKDASAAKVLGLNAEQRAELTKVAEVAGAIEAKRDPARKRRQEAEKARNETNKASDEAKAKHAKTKTDKKDPQEVQSALNAANVAKGEATRQQAVWKRFDDEAKKIEVDWAKSLDAPSPVLKAAPRAFVIAALNEAMKSPTEIAKRSMDKPRVQAVRKKRERLGVEGKATSEFAKALREESNAVALAEVVLPGLVQAVFHANFVDARLTTPKRWRDVYHYEGDTPTGWTRYSLDAKEPKTEFTAEGWLVVKHDDKGRAIHARPVTYRQPAPPAGTLWGNPHSLEATPGKELITFRYEGTERKIDKRE